MATTHNPYPPDYLDNYRRAIRQHDGPLVGDWEDKPHRLGYDLLNYAEYLEKCLLASYNYSKGLYRDRKDTI